MRIPFSDFSRVVRDCEARIATLAAEFTERFESSPTLAVSSPGRTELVGNHTDHNGGRVVAAAVDLDSLALVAPRNDRVVHLASRGWDAPFVVDLTDPAPSPEDHPTAALIRGVAAGLRRLEIEPHAFSAVAESAVLPGSGLSSSASIEILIAEAFLAVTGRSGDVNVLAMARAGQFAENEYMGKPSGLMDQLGCAHGGAVAIDFGTDPPKIDSVSLTLEEAGYRLAVVATGGDHADLTPDYAAVPTEMKGVAASLGADTLATAAYGDLLTGIPRLRAERGDRAVLRAMHYFEECRRASEFADAANSGDVDRVIEIMRESGSSSWRLLQNVHTDRDARTQPMAIALALTESFLRDRGTAGACRVHGGGFAGTILAAVQTELYDAYVGWMESALGPGCIHPISIRRDGIVSAKLT